MDEEKVFPKGFIEVGSEVLKRKRHTMVCFCGIVVLRFDVEGVFVRNDVFDEFNGGVAFSSVFLLFFFGCNDDVLEAIGIGVEFDFEVMLVLPFSDSEVFVFVPYHLEAKGGILGLCGDGEFAVEVGGRSYMGWFPFVVLLLHKIDLHQRKGFSGFGIHDESIDECIFLRMQLETGAKKQQQPNNLFVHLIYLSDSIGR